MAKFKEDQISKALLAKLYESMTAQPDIDEINEEVLPNDQFIAWCQPGIPFRPEDFLFATRGIGGGEGEGEDVRQRMLLAEEWSQLTNFVPNPSGIYDEESQKKMFDTTSFNQDGVSMVSIYKNILQFSEVATAELDEELKERVKRVRGLLKEVTEVEDLMTGEKKEKIDDSALIKAYRTYEGEYVDEALLYNTKRLNALNSDDAAAVQDFALNAPLYRSKVRSALNKWISTGYKYDVERIYAFLESVTQRDLQLLKAEYQEDLRKAEITNPVNGSTFYWTSLIPASLPFSDGWMNYSFKESEVSEHSEKTTNQWEGSATPSLLKWFKPSTSGETEKEREVKDTSNFSMSFEVAQAMISRPWFAPEFLLSDAWRFSPDMPNLANLTTALSDGEVPPTGSMIAYPTTAIFVRNVQVDFNELHEEESSFKRDIDAGLDIKIGPVKIAGGSYQRGDERTDFESHLTEQGLSVPGLQLIGFKCKLLPKLPNPSPDVENWT
ncbi:hypothetical protein [Gracilibacillus kekensis]|uniref:Uncharacterized protein n=1 Tax=Gracilibacillus kekensis TaxID=1027249 RepID=A0A1M7QUN5_9BACI|nr:hypothetical protein [Gracilibacillus kekensis]SHN35182.1 hypothetical protein SAMN05216179_3599 [Gracilibacillus kekensis]